MTPEHQKRKGGARLAKKAPKTEREPRTRDEIIRRRVTILAVVAAVLLLLAIALRLWIREPTIPQPPAPPVGEDGEPNVGGNGGGLAYTSDRKEGVYTFLLLGRDTGGGGNTDTMMVVTYDTVNQTIDVLNIYRDTMVNAPWDIKRINSVYNVNGGGEKGIEALRGYLEGLLGFAPDFYITVEWDAVGELVEALGGVEFDVPYEMHYWDPTQNLRIDQAKGLRLLNGDDAMQVIRWRKNNQGGSHLQVGDTGRVKIQQDFLKAVAQKALKTINLNTVPKYAKILMENVTTNIPLGTIVWFGEKALGMDMEKLAFHGLPGNLNGSAWSRSYKNYQSYVLPDGPAIVELVNAHFNPYQEEVKLSDLDIMSVNRDGSLSSTSGVVRDTKAAVAPVIPTRTPQEPDDEVDQNGPGETAPASPSPDPAESSVPSGEPLPSDLPPEFNTPTPSVPASAEPSETSGPIPTPEPVPDPTPTPTSEPTPPPVETDIPPEFLPPMPSAVA